MALVRARLAILLALGFSAASLIWPCHFAAKAQTVPDSYRVYTEHPRLFLRPQKLRLLRRERERNSMRWEQFHTWMSGGAPWAEPGFAYGLDYRITDDRASARKGIQWALSGGGRDLRQAALVYDWCGPEIDAESKRKLLDTLREGLRRPASDLSTRRDQVLAATAIAGDDDGAAEANLRDFVERFWPERILAGLRASRSTLLGSDVYPLFEIFHALRDNLHVDLREDFVDYFRQLPVFQLLSYYPPPFPAAENEFHIPFSAKTGEPDLRTAALSRAAELAIVAYDSNAQESQVLQGWLMNDRFLLRGLFGTPYELLWANPYQPGLSYYHVPLVLHDELLGRLLVRSSWEDDARWAGYIDGQLQEFRDGRAINLQVRAGQEPLDLDEATIYFASGDVKLRSGVREANDIFVVGLPPRTQFHVEIDDEEMREVESDPGGILYFKGVRPKTQLLVTREQIGQS